MTDKERNEEFYKECINAEDKFYNNLTPEEKDQYDTMKEVGRLLKIKQVPFWLFAEVPTGSGSCNYARSLWCPTQGFNPDGSITRSSCEFISHHISALCWHVFQVLIPSISLNDQKGEFPEKFLDLFFANVAKYQEHLTLTTPISTKD